MNSNSASQIHLVIRRHFESCCAYLDSITKRKSNVSKNRLF